MKRRSPFSRSLPPRLRVFFWDVDPRSVDLERHGDFVCARLLQEGGLDALKFLRSRYGDERLRDWMFRRKARGLSPARIRFWQLILELPERRVSAWLRNARRGGWSRRAA